MQIPAPPPEPRRIEGLSDPASGQDQASGASCRRVRPWLLGLGLLAVVAVHLLADPRPPDGVWGVVGMLALRTPTRLIVLALAAVLCVPPVALAVVRFGRRRWGTVARRLGRAPVGAWLAVLALVAWLLRSQVPYGDGPEIAGEVEGGVLISYKQPLDRVLTALTYRAVNVTLGWDGSAAMALVSVAGGLLFAAGVVWLVRRDPLRGGSRWPVVTLLGTSGATAVFFGHMESYALLTAGCLWTLVLALAAVDERRPPLWPLATVFGLTFATHLSAAWLAGAPVAAWWLRRPWRGRSAGAGEVRRHLAEAAACAALASVPIAAVAAGMVIGGMDLGGFSAANFGGGDGRLFVPLTAVTSPYERFTMFSFDHVAAFANELLLLAPVGLVLALTLPLARRTAGSRTDAGTTVLLAATAGALAYAFTFNPDLMVFNPVLGVLGEWDLFALAAVPVTLLGLWFLRTAAEEGEQRDALALAASVVSVVHCVPWLLFNAGFQL